MRTGHFKGDADPACVTKCSIFTPVPGYWPFNHGDTFQKFSFGFSSGWFLGLILSFDDLYLLHMNNYRVLAVALIILESFGLFCLRFRNWAWPNA